MTSAIFALRTFNFKATTAGQVRSGPNAAMVAAFDDQAAPRSLGVRLLTVLGGAAVLAAIVTLMIVSGTLIGQPGGEHALLKLTGLWVLAFAGIVLVARAARLLPGEMLHARSRFYRQLLDAREEREFRALAQQDQRLLQELRIMRDHADWHGA